MTSRSEPPQTEAAQADSLKNFGNARKAAGDIQGAIECYRRALKIDPCHLPSLYNLGLSLREDGKTVEAERHFRRLHELAPMDADCLLHLGALLYEQSSFEEAASMFRNALDLVPSPNLWVLLGNAVRAIGRNEEARRCYEHALELDPELVDARNDLANILQDEGRLDEAIEHYRKASGPSPTPGSHNNLGCALVRRGMVDEAVSCFLRAIELKPDYAEAHMNLGSAYTLQGARDLAVRSHRTALELRPQDAVIRECLLSEMQNTCDWSQLEELVAMQRRAATDPSQRVSPFSLLSIPSTPAEQFQCARNFAKRLSFSVRDLRGHLDFRFQRSRKEKLTIGYLSADFHDHVTAYVMAEMFELHDRKRFKIAAYSYGPDDNSAMRERLRRAFDRFVDGQSLPYADLAATIHADGVDILVDLKGYTQHARTEVMALRPAPVQAAYMGYPGTLSADFIDYLMADRFVVPPQQEKHYGEKVVFLPGSYYVNDTKRKVVKAPSRIEAGLPDEAFVFCCFNQAYKILPEMFSIWMRLLAIVPGSVLWLLESNPWAKHNLRQEADHRGVSPDRLIFAPRISADRHLERVGAADLFLDTLPYNAHTTATDALWAGVPVVTCPGQTYASRVGGSLLSAMGASELITSSLAEYEARALQLAREPVALAAIKEKISACRTSSSLFDTAQFTRNVERAYEQMWANHANGISPRRIEL